MEIRYALIPFLYTLFHQVHVSGGTVVRSMAHVFPTNPDCWSLDEQFLWGSSLLIAPVIFEGHRNKSLFLPDTERWYDYYTGEEQSKLGHVTVSAPLDFIPLYLRGGAVIPHQKSAMNTVASRKNPLYLLVALDQRQSAEGKLFWDDGDSIDTFQRGVYNYFGFEYNANRLTIAPWTYKYPRMGEEVKLGEVRIFGLKTQPARIVWNGKDLTPTSQWTFDATKNVLEMKMLELDVAQTHRFLLL